MPVGFESYAQDGSDVVQIDDRHLNYFLRTKGVAVTDFKPQANYPPTQRNGIQLSGFRGPPIVTVNCGVPVMVSVTDQGNGNHLLNLTANAAIGTAVSWWAFDSLGNDEGSDGGLQIFNEQLQLQYDAAKKPMRVVDVIYGATGGETRTYAAGRVYAVAESGGGGSVSVGGANPGYVLLVGGSVVNDNQVGITRFQVLGGTGGVVNDSRAHYGMVVDVTNY